MNENLRGAILYGRRLKGDFGFRDIPGTPALMPPAWTLTPAMQD